MFKKIFLLFSFIICMLLSVSCASDSKILPTATATTTPTESPPLIIDSPTTTPMPSATPELTEVPTPTEAVRESIIVGSKEDTEQLLLAKMLVLALERAGLQVEYQTGYGDTQAIREALEMGELDLYWESVLEGLTVIHELPIEALPNNSNRRYTLLKELDKAQPLVWFDSIKVNEEKQMASVVRQPILERKEVNEVLVGFFDEMGSRLHEENRMSQLNDCVELGADKQPDSDDEMLVEEVARAFLDQERLACLPSPIRISSSFDNRNLWVGKLLQLLLKDKGYEVVDKTELGSPSEVRQAIENDEVDIYCEFLGRVLVSYYGFDPEALPTEPERLFALVKGLDAKKGLLWPRISENVLYSTLVVSDELYEQGIGSMTELADLINADERQIKLCTEPPFYEQADGIRGLETYYGFKFKEENIVFTEEQSGNEFPNYDALQEGRCDVAHGRTTDDVELWNMKILEDPDSFFPPLIPGLLMRQDMVNQYPELGQSLVCLNDYISSDSLINLNRLTWGPDERPDTGDEESMETVGQKFLCEVGLISKDCPVPPITATASPTPVTPEPLVTGVPVTMTVTATVTMTATATPVCEELVLNGDFEGDESWVLPATSGKAEYSTDVAHSADRSLLIGYSTNDEKSGQSVSKQLISIPSDAESATLSYWYYPISNDPQADDVQGALILSGDESIVVRQLQRDLSDERAWSLETHDLSGFIGEEVVLYFYVDNNGDGQASGMYVDEVSVQMCKGSE